MDLLQRFSRVNAMAFDMDGVLTDGGLWLLPDGEWMRRMHIRDGYALQAAVKAGYPVMVISGSVSKPVEQRLRRLGVTDVQMGVTDKVECLVSSLSRYGTTPDRALFMGDDIPDLKAIQAVGVGCCPSDAVAEVREASDYVSPHRGGEGCVRDVIELVMRSGGKWSQPDGISSV
jgi:3-deoxy-D-manno-octulosonate 8-phosphate phosphatase (KDO 8-P phosphatase)